MDKLSKKFLNSSIMNRIQALVDNTVNYRIMKETGLYENALTRLREHDAQPKNLALSTAVKLDRMARKKYSDKILQSTNRKADALVSHVKKVLKSHLTSYHMAQESNISISVFSIPRSRGHNIGNIHLQSALQLNQFYLNHKDEIKKSMEQPVAITSRMINNVQAMIDSGYSSYRLAKRTHINPSVTSRLFRGQTNIKNARPKNIQKISHFYEEHKADL